MNSLQLRATLYSATASTFEELALLCPSPDVGRQQRLAPLAGSASVSFDGPIRGAITLSVTADVLATAATNMLARDEPPAPAMQRDAMCELANVVCGSLLPLVAGRRAIFRLGVPRWRDAAGDPLDTTGTPIADTLVGVDGGRIEVSLFVDNARLATEAARS